MPRRGGEGRRREREGDACAGRARRNRRHGRQAAPVARPPPAPLTAHFFPRPCPLSRARARARARAYTLASTFASTFASAQARAEAAFERVYGGELFAREAQTFFEEGTRENPIPILSTEAERVVGISLPDEAETRWFTLRKNELIYDPDTCK